MLSDTSLIDVSDSELTPRARTLKRKQLRRLKDRTLRRRRKELFVNLSTEFAALSRAQRRKHVAQMKEMMAAERKAQEKGVSFVERNELDEEEEEEVRPAKKEEESEHSTILRREVSALQMKIERLKDVADQAAKVAKERPSSRRSTLSDVSKLISPQDPIKNSNPSKIRRTESDKDLAQSLRSKAVPEPVQVLEELDRLGEDLKSVASVLRDLVVEEEKQREKGMEKEEEEQSQIEQKSRKRKHKGNKEEETEKEKEDERKKKRRKKHHHTAEKEQRGVKRKRTKKEEKGKQKLQTKKPKAKHSSEASTSKEDTEAQQPQSKSVAFTDSTKGQPTQQSQPQPQTQTQSQPQQPQPQHPPQHFNTLARAYTVLSDAQETRMKAAYAKQRIEQMYGLNKGKSTTEATTTTTTSTEDVEVLPCVLTIRGTPAVAKGKAATSHCKDKNGRRDGEDDDNKENGEGGAKVATNNTKGKRPLKIQRQTRQRNLKKILQERLPELTLLRGTRRNNNNATNKDAGESVMVVENAKKRSQGYRNESFYTNKQSEVLTNFNLSARNNSDNVNTNNTATHNHTNTHKRNNSHSTHNRTSSHGTHHKRTHSNSAHNNKANANTINKENIDNNNVPQLPEQHTPTVKKATRKRAMPLLGDTYDESDMLTSAGSIGTSLKVNNHNINGTLREKARDEEEKRKEMAKRQASLVMQKRGTLRSLKKPPLETTSSCFYNPAMQKTATLRR